MTPKEKTRLGEYYLEEALLNVLLDVEIDKVVAT